MALRTDKKLYIALGVAVLLGGAVFLQKKAEKKEEQSYSLEGRKAGLPKLEITEKQAESLDQIIITKPGKSEGDAGVGEPEKFVLKKEGEEWKLLEPVKALANQKNVESLLKAFPKLAVRELISSSKDSYAKYDLEDEKALHVVGMKGEEKVVDLYFGEGGSRGNMTRMGGKDGVFTVKGYSSYQFSRDIKGWRDRTIFKFETETVATVELENENGTFSLTKKPAPEPEGDAGAPKPEWEGKLKQPKAPIAMPIPKFDGPKVEDLLRAFKSLNATDFGDDKSAADVGLDEPIAKVTIALKDGAKKILLVGATAEGTNRWAMVEGSKQVYSVSSYVSGWAMADADKFRKPADREKKEEKKPAGGASPGMPGGMPGGMPPGMGGPPPGM